MTLDQAIDALLAHARLQSQHRGQGWMSLPDATNAPPNGAGIPTNPNPDLLREAMRGIEDRKLGTVDFNDPRGYGYGQFRVRFTTEGASLADQVLVQPLVIQNNPPAAVDFATLKRNGARAFGVHTDPQTGATTGYLLYRANGRGYAANLGSGVEL